MLRWCEIVGPDIARIAEPLRLTEGPEGAVLTLKCEAGAAVFLQHQTRELLQRLTAYLGRPGSCGCGSFRANRSGPTGPRTTPPSNAAGPDEPPAPAPFRRRWSGCERRRGSTRKKTR